MALLGAQIVITLVMVSVIQKLTPHFSLAKWLLCSTGLHRFLHPSDTQLKSLAGVPKTLHKPKKSDHSHHKGGSRHNGASNAAANDGVFHVPRNLDIQLETTKIEEYDLLHLRYYTEYQWLVDFSLYTGLVYVISEVYHFYFPLVDEMNLSMLWCMMVVLFSFRLLSTLTIQYFRSDESIGERSTCIVTGLIYLLISMIILIVDERTLETGLEQAYRSFNETASVFMEDQGVSSSGPASAIIVKFCIAVSCGIIGAIFTFPGLRMARMHWDSLKYCQENRTLQALLNVSFALPFILVLLWVRPLSKDYLTGHVFGSMKEPLLTESAFDTIRLVLVVVAVLLRLCLMPVYLQAYLNIAYDRLEEQKKEAGRITNVELQKNVASIFYYLCVVTLQYVAPILMCMYVALMYKTLGDYRWSDLYRSAAADVECGLDRTATAVELLREQMASSRQPLIDALTGEELPVDDGLLVTARMSLEGLKAIFTTDVYRGLFGFATWWSCFVWFATSSLGMVYQTYFTKL